MQNRVKLLAVFLFISTTATGFSVEATNPVVTIAKSGIVREGSIVTITIQGNPFFNYTLQAATNFGPSIIWEKVTNAVANAQGKAVIVDKTGTNYYQRFYRVIH